jgi:hypothetical protein
VYPTIPGENMSHTVEDVGTIQGQYISFRCPNCLNRLHIIVHLSILSERRRRIIGEIQNYLSREEFSRFKVLNMHEKLIFSIGLFYQKYGRWPCEKELGEFMGLSVQTISKYINSVSGIVSKRQERGMDGKFEKKTFSLNEDGFQRFGELVYHILGERFSENLFNGNKDAVHA